MYKRLMKFIATALVVCLCVPTAGAATVNRNNEIMVRVGLASEYHHNATKELEAAHLQNESGYGSGYRFGYYDSNLNFVELARTNQNTTKVAVLKATNLYYGYSNALNKNTYSGSITSNILVGSYHILIKSGLNSYQEAQTAANEIQNGFVAWINGEYQVRAGAFKSEAEAVQSGQGGTIVGTSTYAMNVVETGTDCILFQYDGGAAGKLAIQPGLVDGEETRTWFNGFHYRGGFQYHRRNGGNVSVVNVLSLEDYVNGVVCYEMGREWPLEALKAQAMCARTYILRRLNSHDSYGYDICNSTYCQVYRGMGNGSASYGPSQTSMQAVRDTTGLVITYNGKLAETPYSSSFGGASEDAKYVWGTDTIKEYPYLRGVVDPYESYVDSVNEKSKWMVSYRASELTQKLQKYGYGANTSLSSLELKYSQLGNVIAATVHWSNGQTNTFYPDGRDGSTAIRSVFGVPSIRFTVNGKTTDPNPSAGGSYTINGTEVNSVDGLYTISGNGEILPIEKDTYMITDSGSLSILDQQTSGGSNQGGSTVQVSGDTYTFEGSGFGHQVGLSQYGANAMAKQGINYKEIITFYLPGVEITHYQ